MDYCRTEQASSKTTAHLQPLRADPVNSDYANARKIWEREQ